MIEQEMNYDRKVRMIWMFLNRRDHVALLLVYIVLLYNTMDTYKPLFLHKNQ